MLHLFLCKHTCDTVWLDWHGVLCQGMPQSEPVVHPSPHPRGLGRSPSSLGNSHLLLLSSCTASCPGHGAEPPHTLCPAACRHLGLPTRKLMISRRAEYTKNAPAHRTEAQAARGSPSLCSLLEQARSKPKPQMLSDFFSFFNRKKNQGSILSPSSMTCPL